MSRRILGANVNLTTRPDYGRLGQLLDEVRAESALIGGVSFGNAETLGQIRYNDGINRLEIGVDDGSGGVEFIPIGAEGDPVATTEVVAGNIELAGDTISNTQGNAITVGEMSTTQITSGNI